MNKFDGILLATDLDGTLLKNDKSISKENVDAIEYFKSEGGKFTFITGRIPFASRDINNIVKSNVAIGCLNGGGIYDFEKEEYLYAEFLDRKSLEFAEYTDKNFPDVGIEVITLDGTYFCKKNKYTEKYRIDENYPDITAHYNDIKEDFAKILLAGEREDLKEMEIAFTKFPGYSDFEWVRSDWHYFEILPKGCNKGKLLKKIAEMYNCRVSVAVGDNNNDAQMIEQADISFAVSNASTLVKSLATHQTVSNEEHAIAKVIEELEKMKL